MKKMKKLRKLVSIMLTLIMVIAMAAPTFAESTVTIEGTGDDGLLKGHTFVAYRIFNGTQGEGTALGNVTWADETAGRALLAALKESDDASLSSDGNNIFATCNTAADVAKVLENKRNDANVVKAFAKIAYKHKGSKKITVVNGTTVDVGYYLIVDETNVTGKDEVNNAVLLQVTGDGDFRVQVKTEKPTVDKKVKEINDSTGVESDWQDWADYDVTNSVKFKLTGTLPSNFMEYETYKYMFTDTLSSGLTVDNETEFTVKAMNGNTESKKFNEGDYTKSITPNNDGTTTITIEFTDLTDFDWGNSLPTSIVIEYAAILNEQAESGAPGNINAVNLTYSNNPNGEGTGQTPDDKVIVFTYDIVANKVDSEKKPLEGARFTLFKWDAEEKNWAPVGNGENEGTKGDDPDGKQNIYKFAKNDAGKYKLVETTTPAGYNTADDLEFEIVATYNKNATGDLFELESLGIQNAKYVDKEGNIIKELTDNDIKGTFTIEASTISTDIVNNKGALLPETGGIGTTIFYVLGSVLILGAGVLLITKKKMGSRE